MIRYLLIYLMLFTASTLSVEAAIKLESYKATYSVKYMGFKAGLIHFILLPQQDDTYVYLSRVEPGLLARFIVNPEAFERTILKITEDGVRPLSWMSEDGKKKSGEDGALVFDWDAEKVHGIIEDKPIELPLVPDLQNRLSMQIGVLLSLLQGGEPKPVKMIDKDKIKTYSYVRKEPRQIKTQAGTYDTIRYASTREGSSRVKHIYHAPSLGYLPVLLESYKKGKLITVMELLTVEPADGIGHGE